MFKKKNLNLNKPIFFQGLGLFGISDIHNKMTLISGITISLS